MLLETFTSLAAPWPLKIILDSVVGNHKLAPWLRHVAGRYLAGTGIDNAHRLHVAALASAAFVLIALLGSVATYVDNYYTESIGQWVANDLRMRIYQHLQRLSLGYYEHARPARS